MVTKICPWNGGVCRRVSCNTILSTGEVVVCRFHGNGSGRSVRHKVKPIHVSVFSKHVLRRNVGGGC
jgi:hypothetical protein